MDVKRIKKGSDDFNQLYGVAKEWWNFWRFAPPSLDILPENMICSYNENGPSCIAFLYSTDSKLAWLEWIVGRPSGDKKERMDGINAILDSAKELGKDLGFTGIFTSSKHDGLNSKLRTKYIETDSGVTHFYGRI